MTKILSALIAVAIAVALGGRAIGDEGTFPNGTLISIPSHGAADPYPSQIHVSGLAGTVSEIEVTIEDINHLWPDDLDVLLVGPSGDSVVLMSDSGGNDYALDLDLVFRDGAPALPDGAPLPAGTYRPTNNTDGCTDLCPADDFPAPAPQQPRASQLAIFAGSDPNGAWELYVVDDFEGTAGQIAGGWSIGIATFVEPSPSPTPKPSPPPAPVLIAPSDGSTNNDATPSFDWLDVIHPVVVTYELHADDSGCSFPSPELSVDELTTSEYSPSAVLADGLWCWRVRALDASTDAASAWSVPFTHHIDTVGPAIALETDCGSDGWCRQPSYTYTAAASDTSSGVASGPTCTLDGAGAPCAGTVSGEGFHRLDVTATDGAGNQSFEALFLSIDSVAPSADLGTECDSPGSAGWCLGKHYEYVGGASDSGSGLQGTTCTLDGAESPCHGTVEGEGPHGLVLHADDVAGNETVRTVDLGIDSRDPVVGAAVSCPEPGNDGWCLAAVEVWPSAADPAPGSGLLDGDPRCTYDGAPHGCGSFTEEDQGSHTFTITAADVAGRESSALATFQIDTTVPATTITSGPPPDHNSRDGAFGFTSDDPDASLECSLDAAAYTTCESPAAYSGLTEGSHTFRVRSIDTAGNVEASPAPWTWRVDVTPPAPPAEVRGPRPFDPSADAEFTWSSEEGATSECALDAGLWQACAAPKRYLGLPEGAHSFVVRDTDRAGNSGSESTPFQWTIDWTPPQTVIDSAPPRTTTETVRFTFSSDEPHATFECSLNSAAFKACTSPKTYTVSDGSKTFRVRAVDRAWNIDETPAVIEWTVDVTPPTLKILRPTAGHTYVDDTEYTFGQTGRAIVYGHVFVEAQARDFAAGVCGFNFQVDGVQVPVADVTFDAARDVYRFRYDQQLGEHVIRAQVLDCAGWRTEKTTTAFGTRRPVWLSLIEG